MNILSPNTPSSLSAKSLSTRKICRNKTTNNCYMHSCYDVVIRVVMKVERCCGVDRSNKQVCFLLPVTIAASGIKTVCRQSCYTEHNSQKRVLTPPPLSPNLQPDSATVLIHYGWETRKQTPFWPTAILTDKWDSNRVTTATTTATTTGSNSQICS